MTIFRHSRSMLFDGVMIWAAGIFVPLAIPSGAVVPCEQFKSQRRRDCLGPKILRVGLFDDLVEPVRLRAVPAVMWRSKTKAATFW